MSIFEKIARWHQHLMQINVENWPVARFMRKIGKEPTMAYKSILMVWDGRDDSLPALNAAIDLTAKNNGHLDVLCVGINYLQPGMYYSEASTYVSNDDFKNTCAAADSFKTSAEKVLKKSDVNWSCQTAVTAMNGLSTVIKNAAWFSDLVILPQPYGHSGKEKSVNTFEAALFQGNSPVLVYPLQETQDMGKKIVVAWNETAESLNAARAALPYLQEAEVVDIAIIDPDTHDPDHADPGTDLSKLLARHDVNVKVSILPRSVPRVSDVLRQRATEIGAGLIVMGAYGHSRLRESILGGATRNMLENVKVPVLMAH